ncbi:MAG: hypothetical protein IIA73_10765 [Proteobacteria bacterium]|nr:hypothetical protein [Pseudomonadota bacterium]
MGELVAPHERLDAAVPALLQQPQGLGAGHRDDARAALDEREVERPVLQIGVDIGRRVLVKLLMRQAVVGLGFRASALGQGEHGDLLDDGLYQPAVIGALALYCFTPTSR